MNDKVEALKEELITKHNYVVKITLEEGNEYAVKVDFAGKKDAVYRVVVDEEDNIYGVSYQSSIMDGEAEEFFPLNGYSVRLYILCDIYRQCRRLDLSYEIVRFFSPEGDKVEFTELLQLPLDEYDSEVETSLEASMDAILNGEVDMPALLEALEKDGLLHSFNVLLSTLV